jgi:hypothetical protein
VNRQDDLKGVSKEHPDYTNYVSPFKLPTDEEVFSFVENEKLKKLEQK